MRYTRIVLMLAFVILSCTEGFSQALPELLYYRFDTGPAIANDATAPVGSNPASITGSAMSVGNLGLSGTALVGTGTTTDFINTGWNTNLSGSWTIGFWTKDIVPSTTLWYIFGDNTAQSLRCFTNGAAGVDNWRLIGTGLTLQANGAATTAPTYTHFVYDAAAGEARSYVNGVLNQTVAVTSPLTFTGTAPFKIGQYATSSGLNGLMDEFRIYNRALSVSEILTTINGTIVTGPCTTATVDTATASPGIGCVGSSFSLFASNVSFGTGSTYQWQSSADSITFADVPGATNPAIIVSPPTTTFYRLIVGCGSSYDTSTITKVTVLGTTLAGGTYTVGASPSDFATLQDALTTINCGGINGPVTLSIKPGTYTGNHSITSYLNNSLYSLNITSANADANSVIISNNGAGNTFTLTNAQNVSFSTITITTTSANGCLEMTDVRNIGVSSCKINALAGNTTAANRAIYVTRGSNLNISGNEISHAYYGIYIIGQASPGYDSTNIILSNQMSNIYYYGMRLENQHNPTVAANRMFGFVSNVSSSGLYFVRVRDAVVSENEITGYMGAYGIYGSNMNLSPSGQLNRFVNNVISCDFAGTTPRAIYFAAATTDTLDGVELYHNSIHSRINTTSGTANGNLYFTGGSSTAVAWSRINVQNNSVRLTRTGATSALANIYFPDTYASNYYFASNNNFYYEDPLSTNPVARIAAVNHLTLADWQLLGKDTLSVSGDPLYNSTTDLNCIASSPNRNAGVTIPGISTDIIGITRDATPDIGAYEIQVAANDLVASSIVSPSSSVLANTAYPVSFKVVNVGSTTATSFTASYQLGAGTIVSEAFSGSLLPLDTLTFTFTQNLTTPLSGSQILSVWTSGPNGAIDGNLVNDTASQLMCLAIPAGTYTVGSPTSNFPSIDFLGEALSCGGITGPVVFHLDGPGNVVTGNIYLNNVPGRSAVNTITIHGQNDTLVATSKSNNIGAVTLLNVSNVTIRNMVIKIGGSVASGVLLSNADSNRITGNTILLDTASTSATLFGIASSANLTNGTTADNSNNNLIDSNIVSGGYYSIRLNGAAGPAGNFRNVIRGNQIRDCYAYNIYILQGNEVVVEGNDISRANRSAATTFYGIYLGTGTISTKVNANAIHNTHDNMPTKTGAVYGLYATAADATSTTANVWSNNMLYNLNLGGSGSIYGVYNSSSDGNEYLHNTFSIDDTTATAGLAYAIYQTTAAVDIAIKNNIISISRGGAGAKYAFYFNTPASTIVSNNNVLSVRSTAGTNGIGFHTSGHTTLAAWQAANGGIYDGASVDADPGLVNILTGDLTPSNIVANNIGANLLTQVPNDFYNIPRTATPDPGAIEFNVAGCPGPYSLTIDSISAYIAVVSWLSVANNWNVEYGPAGFTPGTGIKLYNVARPLTLTGLTTNTPYDVYFQDSCGTSLLSAFNGPLNITTSKDFDLNLQAITDPENNTCEDTATLVRVVVSNKGALAVTGYAATVNASGLITTSMNQVRTTALAPNATDTISMGTLNLTSGGILTLEAFVSAATDVFRTNDTLRAAIDIINVPVPVISTSADSVCNGNSVQLWIDPAIGINDVIWMNAAGQQFATGDTILVSPNLTTTYLAKGAGSQNFSVGAPDTTIGAAAAFAAASLSVQGALVTALQPVRLTRAKIYAQNTGWVVVMLRTTAGTEVDRDSVFVNVTNAYEPNVVNLDLEIPVGDWELNCLTNQSAGGMLRNSTGGVYPYSIPNIFSITGNTFSTVYYYYFYDMQITIGGCETETTSKIIVVNPLPEASFTSTNTGTSYRFDASGSSGATAYSWNFGDGTATTTPGAADTILHTYSLAGTFDVQLFTTNSCGSDTLSQQINVSGVSVEEVDAVRNLQLYPNPSNGTVNIRFEQETALSVQLTLRDMRGRIVFEKQIKPTGANHQEVLQLDHLAKGVYNLEISNDQGRNFKKVVLH